MPIQDKLRDWDNTKPMTCNKYGILQKVKDNMTTETRFKYQLFPSLSEEDFKSLKDDIAKHGILVPVEKDDAGNILDGHHRIRAWEELRAEGIKVPDYPRLIRAGMSEQEKLNHIRALNLLRRHLSTDQQKPHWEEMRKSGLTYQAIAEKSGVSIKTVQRELSESTLSNDKVQGKDGKYRPAAYKPRTPKTILTTNEKQDTLVTDAVTKLGADTLPDKLITEKRAGRVFREAEAEKRREKTPLNIKDISSNQESKYDFRCGRFQVVLGDIPNASIDLICTDPPYGEKYLPDWNDLADYSSRLLKPGAYLVTYSGQMYLHEVFKILSSKLRYVWTIAQINGSSKKNIVSQNKIYSQWKPILIFCKEPYNPTEWLNDTLQGEEREKDFHDWQQGLAEAEFIIKSFSLEGDTVLDPFLGSGTTALASLNLKRKVIGCDIDAACLSQALERINESN